MNTCSADQFPLIYRGENVVQIKKLSHRHLAIMDWLLANPREKLSECAAHFGVSQAWLSTVINSDLFKARMADRRGAIEDLQHQQITSQLLDIAQDGLKAMHDVVRDDEVDPKTKHDISRTALEAIGVLGKRGGGIGVQVNVAPPDPHAAQPEMLQAARARMEGRKPPKVIEGQVLPEGKG